MKNVITVTGPIPPNELGQTLMHEHLFVDLSNWLAPPATAEEIVKANQMVSINDIEELRREPLRSKDNLILNDLKTTVEEIELFKNFGGQTIVEVTLPGIGRDPRRLKKVSEKTGVNIVCGCGYYVASSHPKEVSARTKNEISAQMISDLTEGIDNTEIRAGIIGEIGLSVGIVPDEEKVLRAAVIAANETGAALSIHPPWPHGDVFPIIDILKHEGVDLTRVIFCHMDNKGLDLDVHQAIADEGIYLEYDTFGKEFSRDTYYGFHDPLDIERVAIVTKMVNRGYQTRLLLSQDVCKKSEITKFGGRGYAHISKSIVPMLSMAGVTDEQIWAMRVDNPRHLLPF